MAGSIYILPRDRVHPVDIPFTKAIGVFSKWGTGAGEFIRAMKPATGGGFVHALREVLMRSITAISSALTCVPPKPRNPPSRAALAT
jgi:hypothetical protein